MKRVIVGAFLLSALVSGPAWAADEKPKAKDNMEASESEKGVESIAEEAADAPAEIPDAMKGDEPAVESESN